MKNKLFTVFILNLVVLMILGAPSSIAKTSEESFSYYAKVGEQQSYELKKYNVLGDESQVLTKTSFFGESIKVNFSKGLVTTVKLTELNVLDNATIVPLGLISYGEKTLNHSLLSPAYLRETTLNESYWQHVASSSAYITIENNAIISTSFKNETHEILDKFYWKTGWLAYSYIKIVNGSGYVYNEIEIQNLDYSVPTTSPSSVFFIFSLIALVIVKIGKKKKNFE